MNFGKIFTCRCCVLNFQAQLSHEFTNHNYPHQMIYYKMFLSFIYCSLFLNNISKCLFQFSKPLQKFGLLAKFLFNIHLLLQNEIILKNTSCSFNLFSASSGVKTYPPCPSYCNIQLWYFQRLGR